jgi:hypothetical protein
MGGVKPLNRGKSNRTGFMESWTGTGNCYIRNSEDCSKLMKYPNLLGRAYGGSV